MDMDNAAAFMAGSILYGIGLIALVITIVIINNIISKYWRPIKLFKFDEGPTYQFVDESHENKV
jgi:hypothetical protein